MSQHKQAITNYNIFFSVSVSVSSIDIYIYVVMAINLNSQAESCYLRAKNKGQQSKRRKQAEKSQMKRRRKQSFVSQKCHHPACEKERKKDKITKGADLTLYS